MQYEQIDKATKTKINHLIYVLGKTTVAKIADVSVRTVERWFAGSCSPSVYAYMRLEAYQRRLLIYIKV